MPLNYLELQPQIKQFTANAHEAQKHELERLETAGLLLGQCAADPADDWKNQIQTGSERSALPTLEKPDETFEVQPDAGEYFLLAADGSQIVPSGHDAVPLALINTSRICLQSGRDQAPAIKVQSQILNELHAGMEVTAF